MHYTLELHFTIKIEVIRFKLIGDFQSCTEFVALLFKHKILPIGTSLILCPSCKCIINHVTLYSFLLFPLPQFFALVSIFSFYVFTFFFFFFLYKYNIHE